MVESILIVKKNPILRSDIERYGPDVTMVQFKVAGQTCRGIKELCKQAVMSLTDIKQQLSALPHTDLSQPVQEHSTDMLNTSPSLSFNISLSLSLSFLVPVLPSFPSVCHLSLSLSLSLSG